MIVVFSGYNQRAVVAFLRTLEKNKVESFRIIASGDSDSILKTNYKEKVIYTRKKKKLDLEEVFYALGLIRDISKDESLFLVPSTEALNRFILQYRDDFEQMNCIIPLTDKKTYEIVSDKEKFYQICKDKEIDVPVQYGDMDIYIKPVIAKPKKYVSTDGEIYSPVFLQCEEEYNSFVKKYNKEDFDFQEILNGGISFYLLFYFSNEGEVYYCSQKNLIQQPKGKSIVAACYCDLHEKKEIVKPYIDLFQDINFHGLVMVEVRKVDNKYYMIEANPRFWGPSQLFCDMGYNFFEFMLKDYQLIDQVDGLSIDKNAVYYWSGGVHGKLFVDDNCFWHEDGMRIVKEKFKDFIENDIYKRKDAMDVYYMELLENLYMQNSKHSNYQILPSMLKNILNENNLGIKTRSERERLSYMKKHVDFSQKSILDIGGNTGFFSFELLQENARHIDYYEGNPVHAEFVQTASKVLNVEDRLTVYPQYYLFDKMEKQYDIILCLNVLHHLGDDFKDGKSKDIACKEMLISLNQLASCSDVLIFQMGFNWKGNSEECLFKDGTKEEMETFIKKGTEDYWDIIFIGIAEKKDDIIIYQEMNDKNNRRQDDLGEFLNRPLFIMKSKERKGQRI